MTSKKINGLVIFWTTVIGGFMSSLVKWGSEVNMPPRAPGEISPPGAHIDAWLGWMGVNQHSLDYMYQGNSVLGAVTLYHWLFSFAFAFVYVVVSYYWNNIRLWFGALYGIIITVVMHGFLIPCWGFAILSMRKGRSAGCGISTAMSCGARFWGMCTGQCRSRFA